MHDTDAIEVLNGGSTKEANAQAKLLAKSLGLPGTAGSDAHQVSDLFSVCSIIEADLNVDSILNSIKKGSVSTQISHGLKHL